VVLLLVRVCYVVFKITANVLQLQEVCDFHHKPACLLAGVDAENEIPAFGKPMLAVVLF